MQPLLSGSAICVLKRLAYAFGLVMVHHALFVFGLRFWFDAIPTRVAGLFYFGFWLAPATIYLVALYGVPVLSTFQSRGVRLARVAVLTGIAFGLSVASSIAFLALWFAASIVFGFPLREA